MTLHFSNRQNRSTSPALALLTLIVPLLLSACSMNNPAPATPDANLIATAAGQTLEAGGAPATITAISSQFIAQSTAMQATQQFLAPTLTALVNIPSPTTASTPGAQTTPQPGATAGNASGLPSVSVSADTNCRQGPATAFPVVSLLKVGASTTVHGKDSSGQWYYVASPSGGSGFCWLWGQYATLQGNTAGLAVVQAPSAPTPATTEAAVTVAYDNIHRCDGDVATARVDNTGGVAFASARMTVRDLETGEVLGQVGSSEMFLNNPGACPPGISSLGPGDTGYVVAPLNQTPPAGTSGRIIVMVCTEPGLQGDCQEGRIDFEFP